MAMSPEDLVELKQIFRAECDEHLGALNGLLMTLERQPDDAATLNETFRRMHSVKGAARMVGYAGIEAVGHGLESMLADARSGTQALNKASIALLFSATDTIRDLMAAGAGMSEDELPVQEMLARMALFRDGESVAASKPKQAAKPTKETPPVQLRSLPTPAGAVVPIAPERGRDDTSGDMVRVGADKIDRLIALRGELLRQFTSEEQDVRSLVSAADATFADVEGGLRSRSDADATPERKRLFDSVRRQRESLQAAVGRIDDRNLQRFGLLESLRDSLADLRMLPAGTILQPLARVVRDISQLQDKDAELSIAGADIALDKVVLEAIKEPLIHLVRNAVAHGIEPPALRLLAGKRATGTVKVSVTTGSSSATVKVEDDGAGIDTAAVRRAVVANGYATAEDAAVISDFRLLQYLFKPGFSTSASADNISGRGVGLDVVADRVTQLRGSYHVESTHGVGTRFILRVPVSLLTSSVLAVHDGTTEVFLRQTDIHEAVSLKPEHVINVEGRISATVRDEVMPVLPLASIMGGPAHVSFGRDGVVAAIIIKDGERRAAVVVEALAGLSDVIVKPLPRPLGRIAGIAGYAISTTGLPLCVLDGEHFVRSAHERGAVGNVIREKPAVKRRLLIADDSLTTRTLLRNIMISAGYEVETAIDGVDAWNKASTMKFDCIMSDIEMPNMNGWEFCERVKRDARLADTPIVLVTSLSREDERRRGLELGADAYVVKGLFNETQLLETVERLVA
ncbi:MAG TPA: response regulator [Candidatus Eremiobacteraceae bacterium]